MISLHRAEDVAAEVRTRLARCTVAQGAETDIGATVYQGRRRIDEDMIPCVTVIEGPDTPDRTRVRDTYEIAQQYVIFAYVACDPNNPNVAAHAAIRDIKRSLFTTDGKGDGRFGGAVMGVDYLGRDIGPRADGAAFVVAAVEISVNYSEQLSAP